MKWKFIITGFTLSLGTLIGIVVYYDIDPALLATLSFYENLANPSIRIIRVEEGLRKEQIASIMAGKLGWDQLQKNQFIDFHLALNTTNLEGHYFPYTYMILKNQSPSSVTATMLREFNKETSTISKPKSKNIVNPDTALKVASIVQREASGKGDMKLIAGIIWNRLFSGMKLQVDATLQYAKGSEQDGWWSEVTPVDKKIDSSYNTYLHVGLPPSPISNPGLSAIDATYNPVKTSCLFFMHDKRGNIHCSRTYEEHKKNIARYL